MSKLSIIVAIYNVEDFLYNCLSSLANQKTNIEYEVLCVNDGSTDRSKSMIERFVKENSNFILLDKPNGGISDARNYGLKYANSPYISFVDGDDYVSEDYVEKIINTIEKDNLDMVVFNYYQFSLKEKRDERIETRIKEGIYCLKENKKILAYTANAVWNKAYKKELFNDIEFPYGYRHQDLATTPKLLLKANKIGYINEYLYHYIVDRPDNITGKVDKDIYHIIDMAKNVLDYYKEINVFNDYYNELEYLIKRNFIQSLRKTIKIKDKEFVYKFIDDIFDVVDKYFTIEGITYTLVEEKGDDVYLSRSKCKRYYSLKHIFH